MRFDLEPSLQSTTYTTIVSILWDSNDVRSYFPKILIGDYDNRIIWYQMWNKIARKVLTFRLPEPISTTLHQYAIIVGLEILNWLSYHGELSRAVEIIPKRFFFTPHGSIDLLKTASVLIEDETLDPINRFRLACVYCQQRYINLIWPVLDQRIVLNLVFAIDHADVLVSFWSLYLQERLNVAFRLFHNESLKHTYTLGLYISIIKANVVATSFFCEKLNREEREEIVILALTYLVKSGDNKMYVIRKYVTIFSFLLNTMDDETQNRLFRKFPTPILTLFLDPPWQGHFIELYRKIHYMISNQSFYDLLNQIIYKEHYSSIVFDYQKLFIKVWESSSATQKSYIYARNNRMYYILYRLHSHEHWQAFKTILSYAPADWRSDLLFSRKIMSETLKWLHEDEKYGTIIEFLAECLTTKEILEFKNKITSSISSQRTMQNVNKLLTMIDDHLSSSKRKCTEADGNDCKKVYLSESSVVVPS